MREISFEESKQIMIKTLESIDKCCRKNDIQYSLCWGTMIGAIRHHGFIPWDDDIDIMMSRADYNRFITVYNDSDYNVYTLKKGDNWHMLHTRVSNKNTEVFFNYWKKSPHGCWISIFPFDNAPDDNRTAWERKRSRIIRLFQLKTSKWNSNVSIARNCLKVLFHILLSPVPTYLIGKRVNKVLAEYNNQRTREVSIWDNGYGITKFFYFPSDLFDEYEDVVFDGVRCRIIKGYDSFLRMYYGDYMQLPPLEKQVPSHDYRAYYIE